MTTVTAKPLVSVFAQFVQGDIKGGAAAHAFRTATLRTAIEQLFKGNYSPITEAATLTEGKAKKARAYHAGFATLGVVGTDTKKVDYVGALNSAANKAVRDVIEQQTHAATAAFFVAFDAVMAEKGEPKAKTAPAPTATPTVTAPATEAGELDADTLRHNMAVEQDNAVAQVVALLNLGMLTGEQVDLIDGALIALQVRNAMPAHAAQPAMMAAH